MAPDVKDIKALATALKMNGPIETVQRLAHEWFERGMSEKKPEDFEEAEDRAKWYDLRDSWERATTALKNKVNKFETENGRSPILRYWRQADEQGTVGKIYLGYDSAQAKGYRIMEITPPRWFEELNLPTENMSEEDVYKLVPAERLSDEQLDVLRQDYLKDLEEAGISAYEKRGEINYAKPEFLNRFLMVIDKKRTYNENVFRVDDLAKAIVREHALALRPPAPGVPAVAVPLRVVRPVTVEAEKRPVYERKKWPIDKFYVMQVIRVDRKRALLELTEYQLHYQIQGSWDYKELGAYEQMSDFMLKGEAELPVHATRGTEIVTWKPLKIPRPVLAVNTKWRQEELGFYYTLEQAVFETEWGVSHLPMWVWRISSYDEKRQKDEEVNASERQLLSGQYGFPKETVPPEEVARFWEETHPQGKLEEAPTVSAPAPKFPEKADLISLVTVGVMWSWDSLRDELRKRGFDVFSVDGERRLRDVLGQLLREGTFYEPRPEFYARSEARVTAMAPKAEEKPPVVAGPPFPAQIPSEVKVKLRVEQGMNLGEYFVHLLYDSFEVTFSGVLSTQALKDYLEEKEDYVDFTEQLSLQGFSEAKIPDELKKLPWPFSSGQEIKLVWTEADITFSPKAREWWDIFNKVYSRKELEFFDFEGVKTIAKLKGVRVGKDKSETVASILGETIPAVTAAPPPTPPPTAAKPPEKKGLTSADINKLQDVYSDHLFRELGRVPTNSLATFRVEIDKVKDKTFSEAQEHILGIADDIIGAFAAREGIRRIPTERRVPVGAPEPEVRGAPMGRVPPAQFPSFPLCVNLPFPRGPCSEEKIKLWDVFCYQMQESDYDCMSYQKEFEGYIEGTQFLSWEDLRAKFKIFVETIMKGLALPPLFTWQGAPIPTGLKGEIMERLPLEQLEDLITHYSSVVIRNARSKGDVPTLNDLKEELAERGIIPETTTIGELRDATKTALTHAIERKDLWVSGISTTEINDFLASG